MSDAGATADTAASISASTLLEFPGARPHRPAWRKALSERVREIQQRRALEAEEAAREQAAREQAAFTEDTPSVKATKAEERAKQLGLVPPPLDMPEMNPIVAAALKRIERARTSAPPRGRATRATQTATAAARVIEEHYEPKAEAPPAGTKPVPRESRMTTLPSPETTPVNEKSEPNPDSSRLPNLVAVPPKQPVGEKPAEMSAKPATEKSVEVTTAHLSASKPIITAPPPLVEPEARKATNATAAAAAPAAATDKPEPRRIEGVIDDHWLERRGADSLPKVVTADVVHDDRAPLVIRFAGAFIDLLVVAFLSAPFAAIIELTISNWGDPRVQSSMGGIVIVVMFLYLTCSTALAGRTWGMSLYSLQTVDADSALAPTTGQCVRRTIVYMLSLATFGIGLLYALFDAQGRTAHDLLSRTSVVKE